MKNKDNIKGWIYALLIGATLTGRLSTNRSSIVLADRIFYSLGIPVWSGGESGLNYSSVFGLALLFIFGGNLKKCWKKQGGICKIIAENIIIFIIVLAIMLPKAYFGAEELGRSFQKDVKALYCDKDQSVITYEFDENKDMVNLKCNLVFENKGSEEVKFNVVIDGTASKTGVYYAMTENGQAEISIMPKDERHLELTYPQSNDSGDFRGSGSSRDFSFYIESCKSGERLYFNLSRSLRRD
ncbi:hypothetical protein SAMN02745945_00309 [Peptoclostridium litorale DSM 5388]|uniref:Uncharacterized protein n=1 Tax=Peptoclostridium litorale DSM 5388 TaxID=1121324 RepID=A0A069RHC6_PEPLI|nr:hypothetical protein [Peptoclostridium litorale]KDR96449.1 hypothetical protein CLIT_2c00550 [Peptoclostridium litorale DSM 5388]SIN70459.1 hypothetical protein SAMN02745945_00309 [Peptoclostridium litorale DSM 5388]